MFETKEQKKYFMISAGAVAVLLAVMAIQRSSFRYSDPTDYSQKQLQSRQEAEAYAKYLESIQTDPIASQELFQEILTEDEVRKEVESQLNPLQPIKLPEIQDKQLNFSGQEGKQAVESYLYDGVGPAVTFSQSTAGLGKLLFSGSQTAEQSLQDQYSQAMRLMMGAQIPREAAAVHRSLLSAFMSYGQLIQLSKENTSGGKPEPWSELYGQYAALNQGFKDFSQKLAELSGRYKISTNEIRYPRDLAAYESPRRLALVPQAEAFLGIGDVTITVGDIPRIIMDAVKEGLVSSFSRFMASFLDKMIQRIESNYIVANFLYYSDALVSGQYADDYLRKYVSNQLDRRLVKEFIPQFSCNLQNEALRPIFQAKASQYLGFDPAAIDPADPDYYVKLSRMGDFYSSPQGWEVYFRDLAGKAEAVAQRAIDRELVSPGLKTPRSSITSSISTSINTIVSAQRAGLQAVLQLGISNAESIISAFVSQITQTLFTKFVFNGASLSPRGGAIGVIKEQSICLAAAQLAPIVPISGTPYELPPAPPNPEDVADDLCRDYPELCPRQNAP